MTTNLTDMIMYWMFFCPIWL